MPKPIIFWGATGQAKVLAEFIATLGFDLVALFDNNSATPPPLKDVPLLYGLNEFRRWRESQVGEIFGLVAIGGSRGRARIQLQQFLRENQVTPIVAAHPSAFVARNAVLGPGSQVLAGATICAEAELGETCIVNSAANVDHECRLGDGVHIGPGAVLSGCVEIGRYSLIGAGAVILPRIKIGENCIVGAGAVVTHDLPANSVAYGNPARIVRENPVDS